MDDYSEREEELGSLSAIYPEIVIDRDNRFAASLELAVAPVKPLLIRFIPGSKRSNGTTATVANGGGSNSSSSAAHVERDVSFTHLPPLSLKTTLPDRYPPDLPPVVRLQSRYGWLPDAKLRELEAEAVKLWDEYGRCQILFTFIDFLQQSAERGFDLDESHEGCHVLPSELEEKLVAFQEEAKLTIFNAGTYDCGICLEPKRGSDCYQLKDCGHVFCRKCLQDFYNNAISEGDVASVRCVDPSCGKETSGVRKRKIQRKLHPRELLAMGVEYSQARRYVEMKRKKLIESDKHTIYCPREWCQAPARSSKYPPIPEDLRSYIMDDDTTSDGENGTAGSNDGGEDPGTQQTRPLPDGEDRLAICEKCQLAFCVVCYRSWHGAFVRCIPRDPNELSAEEQASFDYIRAHTSPCHTCSTPVQKTMGCNHMKCTQCNTHFCYLCGGWLNPDNPYEHFNKPGKPCYQRLWELEGGDDGENARHEGGGEGGGGGGGGGGFGGARGWEQIAIEVAREAELAEAAAVAAAAAATEARAAVPEPAPPRQAAAPARGQFLNHGADAIEEPFNNPQAAQRDVGHQQRRHRQREPLINEPNPNRIDQQFHRARLVRDGEQERPRDRTRFADRPA